MRQRRHLPPRSSRQARRRVAAVSVQLGVRQGQCEAATDAGGGAAAAERVLTDSELRHYRQHGYVVVPSVFEDADFADLEAELSAMVEGFAQEWRDQGLLSETRLHAGESFERRLAALLEEVPSEVRAERQAEAQLRLDSFVARQPAMFEFQVRNPKLGALASSLLGPDVSLSPLQHLRPHMGVPTAAALYAEDLAGGDEGDVAEIGRFWHQDQSVTMAEADKNEDGLTIW